MIIFIFFQPKMQLIDVLPLKHHILMLKLIKGHKKIVFLHISTLAPTLYLQRSVAKRLFKDALISDIS